MARRPHARAFRSASACVQKGGARLLRLAAAGWGLVCRVGAALRRWFARLAARVRGGAPPAGARNQRGGLRNRRADRAAAPLQERDPGGVVVEDAPGAGERVIVCKKGHRAPGGEEGGARFKNGYRAGCGEEGSARTKNGDRAGRGEDDGARPKNRDRAGRGEDDGTRSKNGYLAGCGEEDAAGSKNGYLAGCGEEDGARCKNGDRAGRAEEHRDGEPVVQEYSVAAAVVQEHGKLASKKNCKKIAASKRDDRANARPAKNDGVAEERGDAKKNAAPLAQERGNRARVAEERGGGELIRKKNAAPLAQEDAAGSKNGYLAGCGEEYGARPKNDDRAGRGNGEEDGAPGEKNLAVDRAPGCKISGGGANKVAVDRAPGYKNAGGGGRKLGGDPTPGFKNGGRGDKKVAGDPAPSAPLQERQHGGMVALQEAPGAGSAAAVVQDQEHRELGARNGNKIAAQNDVPKERGDGQLIIRKKTGHRRKKQTPPSQVQASVDPSVQDRTPCRTGDEEEAVAYATFCLRRSQRLRSKKDELCHICFFKRGQAIRVQKDGMPKHCMSEHHTKGLECEKTGCVIRTENVGDLGNHNKYLHEMGSRVVADNGGAA
ncbi:hypothetical protein ACP70R_007513 [Stipagrostis hirtigluma subsp. patula]